VKLPTDVKEIYLLSALSKVELGKDKKGSREGKDKNQKEGRASLSQTLGTQGRWRSIWKSLSSVDLSNMGGSSLANGLLRGERDWGRIKGVEKTRAALCLS